MILLFCPPVVGVGSVLFAELVVLVLLVDGPAHQLVGVQDLLSQRLVNTEQHGRELSRAGHATIF